jgi:hypothetical protein
MCWATFCAIFSHTHLVTLTARDGTETTFFNNFLVSKTCVGGATGNTMHGLGSADTFAVWKFRRWWKKQGCQIFLGATYQKGKKYTRK